MLVRLLLKNMVLEYGDLFVMVGIVVSVIVVVIREWIGCLLSSM